MRVTQLSIHEVIITFKIYNNFLSSSLTHICGITAFLSLSLEFDILQTSPLFSLNSANEIIVLIPYNNFHLSYFRPIPYFYTNKQTTCKQFRYTSNTKPFRNIARKSANRLYTIVNQLYLLCCHDYRYYDYRYYDYRDTNGSR